MHFPTTLAAVLVLLSGCLVYMFVSLGTYDSEDREQYHQLIESVERGQGNNPYKTSQEREGLRKDIFFVENGKRLQLRLRSEHAELALQRREDRTEIIEYMRRVTCYLQEELFFLMPDGREAEMHEDGRLFIKGSDRKDPDSWVSHDHPGIQAMQSILFLESEKASYNYKSELFTAENVKVSRYRAAGHTLDDAGNPLESLTNGIAGRVEFSLGGKGINFKADAFKATFYMPQGKKP
jgi:hypothetical protein